MTSLSLLTSPASSPLTVAFRFHSLKARPVRARVRGVFRELIPCRR